MRALLNHILRKLEYFKKTPFCIVLVNLGKRPCFPQTIAKPTIKANLKKTCKSEEWFLFHLKCTSSS